jgi:hypothetical protein
LLVASHFFIESRLRSSSPSPQWILKSQRMSSPAGYDPAAAQDSQQAL